MIIQFVVRSGKPFKRMDADVVDEGLVAAWLRVGHEGHIVIDGADTFQPVLLRDIDLLATDWEVKT